MRVPDIKRKAMGDTKKDGLQPRCMAGARLYEGDRDAFQNSSVSQSSSSSVGGGEVDGGGAGESSCAGGAEGAGGIVLPPSVGSSGLAGGVVGLGGVSCWVGGAASSGSVSSGMVKSCFGKVSSSDWVSVGSMCRM